MARIWKRRAVKDGSRLAWNRISTGDVDRIRDVLAAKYAPATANRALAALRKVLYFSWRDGSLTHEDYERLAAVEAVRGEGGLRGRALAQTELDRLYAVCAADPSPAGARDGAVIALGHAAGLRAGEIVGLDLADVTDPDGGELLVRGKGGTLGGASLGEAAPALGAWLALRGDEPGPLLYPVRRTGRLVPRRLSAIAVFMVVRKRAAQAGVENVSPHCLRKTHATALLRAGFDHLMVMRSLRHRDVRSVRAYDRRTEDERRQAQARAIHVNTGRK
jgi:integrase